MTVYPMSHFSRCFLLGFASVVLAEGPSQGADPETPKATWAAAEYGGRMPARGLLLESIKRQGTGYVASLAGGGTAELTLDPRLQEAAEGVFDAFHIPYAGAVVISISDGRVLALAGRSAVSPELGPEELALQDWAPAASVFKIVSATALVSEGGLNANSRTCYHAGVSSVLADNLVDMPRIDTTCATLAYGIGKSQNAILAKLSVNHLRPDQLDRVGRSLGFGRAIPFDVPIAASHLDVPATDRLEFGRAAAGFWHSTLSPMHGALIAATIANGGDMPAPRLVERATSASGHVIALPSRPSHPAMSPAVAREVGQMMEFTTRMGTAKGAFHDKKGRPLLSIGVAGKTGTLSATTDKGYLGYSWFVGYAPIDHPQIAFAVALGNQSVWRIKASYVGRRIVEEFVNAERDRRRERTGARLLTASR